MNPSTIESVLKEFNVTVEDGLTTDEAEERRESAGGHFNTVDPPIKCPAWICCLLPCIKHIPSMKAYKQIAAEDAEVKRNGQWIRYDAASLVYGDIIRVEDGDIVPADCSVLFLEPGCAELLADHRMITGQEKPVSVQASSSSTTTDPVELLWGGRVILGSAVCICTAVGPNTKVAQLIALKRFPVATAEVFATTRFTVSTGSSMMSSSSSLPTTPYKDEEAGVLLVRTQAK